VSWTWTEIPGAFSLDTAEIELLAVGGIGRGIVGGGSVGG
jgi:hypothetical protein